MDDLTRGRKRKKDGRGSPDRHTRPAAQLKGGCVCTVENLGRKKWKRKRVEGDSSQQWPGTAVKEASPLQRQQAGLWIVGLLLDSWVQLMGGQTLWKSACLPAASCCVQRPAVTAQGSELIARAGSSMGWRECSEVDFSEVALYSSSRAQLALTVSSSQKKKRKRNRNSGGREGREIIVIFPFSRSFILSLSSAPPATCGQSSASLQPESGGGSVRLVFQWRQTALRVWMTLQVRHDLALCLWGSSCVRPYVYVRMQMSFDGVSPSSSPAGFTSSDWVY